MKRAAIFSPKIILRFEFQYFSARCLCFLVSIFLRQASLVFLILLLEGDVLDVEVDLGPVLERDGVEAELLELLYLPIRRIHISV